MRSIPAAPADRADKAPLLAVRALTLEFGSTAHRRRVLRGVDLDIGEGEIVGIVGESGSGKSLTALSILGLTGALPSPVFGGAIELEGRNVLPLPESTRRAYRGRWMAYVPQEPMNALNPTRTVGAHLADVLGHHFELRGEAAAERGRALLKSMAIADPPRVWNAYPFELSGGMRQRVLMAMAFACEPRVILADEPTSALDVTVQAQILGLLRSRARESGAAVLFITHDLAVVAQLCDRVYVMYAGTVVEHGAAAEVLATPRHPYTRALLASRPMGRRKPAPLPTLELGSATTEGCVLLGRCPVGTDACRVPPALLPTADGRRSVACWHAGLQ